MRVETGYLSSVTLHDDGRISLTRAENRLGLFLHIDLSEREIEALKKVISERK